MEIKYAVSAITGSIFWSAQEDFSELSGNTFNLSNTRAVDIENMVEFSERSRILLSAVAGAVIQHLLDGSMDADFIFKHGVIIIP